MKENPLPKVIAAATACVITVALFHSVAMLAVEPEPAVQVATAPAPPAPPATTSARMHLALAAVFGHHANPIR